MDKFALARISDFVNQAAASTEIAASF